jgi:hypothetical protein
MKTTDKTWKDVTLEQAVALEKIKAEGIDAVIQQQAILQNKTIDEIENTPMVELTKSQEEWKCIGSLPKEKRTPTAKIGKNIYALCDFSKMSLAQMVDIEEYYREGMLDNAHKIISVIMLPAKRKWKWFGSWTTEEYESNEERENDMLKLDMETVWGNMLFFSTIVNLYMTGLVDYSRGILDQETKRLRNRHLTVQEKQ